MKRYFIVAVTAVFFGLFCFVMFRFFRTDQLNQEARSGSVETVQRVLKTGVALNGIGMHGMTPLMSACAGGNLDTAKYLIEQGANVNGHNDSGSVLMWAIDSGNSEIVELLIKNEVNTEWKNAMGDDASAFAQQKGDARMIELLQ